jgi:hypothetical protein
MKTGTPASRFIKIEPKETRRSGALFLIVWIAVALFS